MRGYVAPAGAVIVSEQLGRRTRLRLVATGRLFTGARDSSPVRAIHLGDEHDERAVQAREGLQRRNCLQAAHKLAGDACKRMQEAHALIDGNSRAGSGEQDDGRRGEGGDVHDGEGQDEGGDRGTGDGGESVLLRRGAHQRASDSHLDRRLIPFR